MRNSLLLLLSLIALCCNAQYYNPYQSAYEYGQQLARQQQEMNQQAYNWGRGLAMYQQGMELIANGDYEEALEKFEEACEYYKPAYEAAGLCYEVGIGCSRDTDYADVLYETGASYNDNACKAAIRRINRNGHYSASYKNTVINSVRNKVAASSGNYVTPVTPSYGGSSGGSSSVYTTCRICGGTGTCTSCHGKGGEVRDTGYYTGSGSKSWISCPSCNGSTRCFNCHGTGKQ